MAENFSFNEYGKVKKSNLFKIIWESFWSQSKFFKTAIVTGLLIIVVTPFITTHYLETRQRAAGEQVSLFFTRSGSNTPLTNLTLTQGESITLDLYLTTGVNFINGFDITGALTNNMTLVLTSPGITEGSNAGSFNTLLFNTWTNNQWRYVKVNNDVKTAITGTLHLASIPLKAVSVGSGTFDFPSVIVVSPQSGQVLTVNKQSLAYAVVAAPTQTPVPTLTPILTSTSTPKPTSILTPAPTKIPDTTPPTITIVSPGDGTTVQKKGSTNISSRISDSSRITKVSIYLDTEVIKTCDNVKSCSIKYPNSSISSGQHTIKVEAIDGSSNKNMASVSITITKL